MKRKVLSEKKVLKELNISDFSQMPNDEEKIKQFAGMLPYMDKEVALKAIEQLPEYKDMACQLANTYKQILSDIISNNSKTVDANIDICNKIIDSLTKTLEKDNLTPDVIKSTQENMLEIAKLMKEIDAQNKGFLLKLAGLSAGIIAILVAGLKIAGTLLDANSLGQDVYESDDDDDDDDDDYDDDYDDEEDYDDDNIIDVDNYTNS